MCLIFSGLRDLEALRLLAAHDCADLQDFGVSTSGVYNISVAGKTVKIWCDMTSEGKGWLVSVIHTFLFTYGHRGLNIPFCVNRTHSHVNIRSMFTFWSLHI